MKIKDLLKITGISLIGVLGVGLSIFGSAKGMTLLAENYKEVNAYSVKDYQESVTFSKEELNNCNYDYLFDNDLEQLQDSYIIYNNKTYNYVGYNTDVEIYYWSNSLMQEDYIGFMEAVCNWKVYVPQEQEWNSNLFEYNLTIYSSYFAENMQKSVTLSASQLNNNSYEYFINYLQDDNSYTNQLNDSYIIYNNEIYLFGVEDSNVSNGDLYFVNNNTGAYINTNTTNYHFEFTDDDIYPFTYSITIYSTYIADNLYAPFQPSNLLQIIVGLLTGGITGIAAGVGSGVSTLTTQIFISNNALSVFGGMIVVFAGLSLAIGLCRWIMQFLTSLGAKK